MNISSIIDYEHFLLKNFSNLKILVFLSNSIESSVTFEEAIRENLNEFKNQGLAVAFIKDDFDNQEDIFNNFGVEFVPSVIALNANFTILEEFKNVSPGELLINVQKLLKPFQQSLELETIKYKQTWDRVFNNSLFILFEFLKTRVDCYEEIDRILVEKQLALRRQSTMPFKEASPLVILAHIGLHFYGDFGYFASHKTPVLYFHKQLIYDVPQLEKILVQEKEYISDLKQTEENNTKSIIANNKVILFVNSNDPNYKEQEDLIKMLQSKKVIYTYLDIANKPAIYGILKKLYNLETLKLGMMVIEGNAIYQHEALIKSQENGFADILKKEYIIESVDDRIRILLQSSTVMVFIKGTPEFPQCGFSRNIIELLASQKVKFGYYNILADKELRERLPTFANWKTFPMVFVNSELVGGLDICKELLENDEFEETFKTAIQK